MTIRSQSKLLNCWWAGWGYLVTKLLLVVMVLVLPSLLAGLSADTPVASLQPEPFKIGWIGPLTGPRASSGAAQASRIAERDVNARRRVGASVAACHARWTVSGR